MKTGLELIAEERKRQVEVEGWSFEHDDEWQNGELEDAARAYHLHAISGRYLGNPPYLWPFAFKYWKPKGDRKRAAVKAGALYRAEIERLGRKIAELRCAVHICEEQIDRFQELEGATDGHV